MVLQHLLDTLCRDVETDLRLHIHMHLQLDSRNPFRVASQQLSTFLRMMPIRLFEHDINTRGDLPLALTVSSSLCMFYDTGNLSFFVTYPTSNIGPIGAIMMQYVF